MGRFVKNVEGAVLPIFAVVLVALMGTAGLAIDYGALVQTRSKMQGFLDQSVLAGLTPGDDEVSEVVKRFYGMHSRYGAVSDVTVQTTSTSVKVGANATVVRTPLFMGVLGFAKQSVIVRSEAEAPRRLKQVLFKPVSAGGWWEKSVKLMVIPTGSNIPAELANVHYSGRGQPDYGMMTTSTSNYVDLGDFSDAYLEFTIGPNAPEIEKYCPNCPRVVKSNDPQWSDRLYLDGQQAPAGVAVRITDWAKCGETTTHDWEDGGGGAPDFQYTLSAICENPDPRQARLTR